MGGGGDNTLDRLGLVGKAILSGKYQVGRVLGAGGMGVVYEGIEVELSRQCALKFILQDLASEQAFKRFLREAQAGARLEHSGIVRVYALERFEGTPFLSLELLKGQSLLDRLKRGGRLPTIADVKRCRCETTPSQCPVHRG